MTNEDEDASIMWETAPCGFAGASFHAQCMAKLLLVQGACNWRCPHCNIPVKAGVAELLGRLADVWMLKEGFGSEKGQYMELQDGLLQQHGNEEAVLTHIVAVLVQTMKRRQDGGCVTVHHHTDDTHHFSCVLTREPPCRLVFVLRRMAFYGKGGCILRDGYAVSASRSRFSQRCPPAGEDL
jgi:hypothetical protein